MVFATKKTFDGQRASIGRIVLLKWDSVIYAGIVTGIRNDDAPEIRFFRSQDADTCGANVVRSELRFAEPKSEAELDDVPDGSWFWPLRV